MYYTTEQAAIQRHLLLPAGSVLHQAWTVTATQYRRVCTGRPTERRRRYKLMLACMQFCSGLVSLHHCTAYLARWQPRFLLRTTANDKSDVDGNGSGSCLDSQRYKQVTSTAYREEERKCTLAVIQDTNKSTQTTTRFVAYCNCNEIA